ncbi:SDR family oxidoreductase [Leptospira noguchii]|uniref:KR domain protein n=1 Tax=Leptospira noguchii serovar Panama str. CZ214 TaxID=1001595 RepID=T0FIQ6_9LEPT|nr:SDR family oxidoreductase [Leptospira noguchii]EQA69525.1 KR domain protein [Leptospira noguchii serovar Panama str. CZ214]
MEKSKNNYITNLFNLENKVAAVIGGGGHLCGEMAKGFARAGCKVVVIDLRKEKADQVADEIKAEGYAKPITFALDVSKKEEHQACLKAILSEFGDLDILINGAGINGPSPFFEISLEEWNSILDSQITGTFLGCQVFGEYMVQKGKGSIINVSSASAGPPLSKAFTYSVAKAGIKNLTQNLGREWGTKGVRVNAIRPGFFPTEWNRKNFISPEREKSILTHTPMARFGEPNELLGAILWLASDASGFVTGAEIAVDGGFSCMTI